MQVNEALELLYNVVVSSNYLITEEIDSEEISDQLRSVLASWFEQNKINTDARFQIYKLSYDSKRIRACYIFNVYVGAEVAYTYKLLIQEDVLLAQSIALLE